MAILEAFHLRKSSSMGQWVIPTELAITSFGLLAGVGGGLAQLIASNRLSQLDSREMPIRKLILPVVLGGGSTALAAFLLPK